MSPQNPSRGASVMIIAGETSGDQHGARLVAAMRKIDDNIAFFGIGGPSMEKEGVEIVVDAASLSVVGITEAFSRMPGILGGLSAIKRAVAKKRPGLVILIDFPDFNLHMARYVKRFSIPVLYYISPQVWAWRSGRIKKIRKYVDRMAVILPFEKSFYEQHGIPVTFVGHPLLDHRFGDPHDLQSVSDGEKRVIGLLPGSRHQEIARNLPVMLAAATHVNRKLSGITYIVSVAPGIDTEKVLEYIRPYREVMDIDISKGQIENVLEQCTMAIAASGTVTLETAIYGVPMVIVYHVSPVSYMLGRALIRVEHIGLANIIAKERIVPELLQKDATPANIAQAVIHLMENPELREETRKKLRMVRDQLGGAGASGKTAGIAYSMIQK
ncbi:MAG: lipid-A-disaccharide synthase [Desulfosalsimonadaceae bacterium]